MSETPILILAAGGSSRMRGADKLAEPIAGVPQLRRIANFALATGAPVYVALPPAPHSRDALLDGLSVSVLRCPDAALGMSISLAQAVAQLPSAARFLVVPADMPDIDTADLRAILDAPRPGETARIWRAATEDGAPGHPVLFDASLRPEFAHLAGDVGGRPIIDAHRSEIRLIRRPGQNARRDLDTPEDWAAYRAGQ